jgi:hypothetical protein
MKTRYRLHCKTTGPGADRAHYWTCSVLFSTPSTEVVMHSGPCTTPGSAIGEAWGLWRKYGIH